MKPAWIVLAVLLGGCLAGTEPPPVDDEYPTAWSELALPFGDDHDHFDYAQHQNLTTPNFKIIGYDPLLSSTVAGTVGGHHCGDAQDMPDGRRIAAVEARYLGGFSIADVTDPSAPKWLGEFVMRQTRVYDVGVVPDGKHVLLVTTSQNPYAAIPGIPPALPPLAGRETGIDWKDACTGEVSPILAATEDPVSRPFSLILVDISDPGAPELVDQRPIPMDGHSIFATDVDGELLILVSVYGPADYDYYQVYTILETEAGAKLEHLSTIGVQNTGPPVVKVASHDGWIAKHPKTGQTLAYMSGGTDFLIADITDPRSPQMLSRWTDYDPAASSYTGSLHSVFPLNELWDDRHYTVLGPEWAGHPGPRPSGTIWVLDTTDPRAPHAVAAWTLPHDVEWNGTYMFSNHYFGVWNETLFVSMYHGGVWAVDLSNISSDTFTLLPSIGVFMPDQPSPKPPAEILRWTPTLQEILPFEDGVLVTFDGASGIYTLRFDESNPMPAPEPWPIDPVSR
ncbi:MAG TPA: hypothetical protein VGB18_08580 [Candidatus Thermoplasmatota archaeon]